MAAIPEKFLRKLDNVAIVIEDEPTPAQKKKLNIHSNWTLLGLYEGVSQTRRGANYNAALPDKITIFQKPIGERGAEQRRFERNSEKHRLARNCSSFWNERISSAPSRNKEDKKAT